MIKESSSPGFFTSSDDYFESGLKRKKTPKLLIGFTYDVNDRATRERRQLGSFISGTRTLTWFADAHFKYRGFSALAEYVDRKAVDGSFIEEDQVKLFN